MKSSSMKLIDACMRLGVQYPLVYRRVLKGEIPAFKEPGSGLWKINESDLPEVALIFGKEYPAQDLTPAA